MDSVQNSAVDDEFVPLPPRPSSFSSSSSINNSQENRHNSHRYNHEDFKYPHEKYTKAANWKSTNENIDDRWHSQSHERVRRATRPKEDNKNTCSLYIQTDPLIWRHIREGIADVSNILFNFSLNRFFLGLKSN